MSVGGERRRAPVDRRVRVLLADDTSDLRSLVRAVLEAAGGFEVVAEAVDGQEAVRLTESHSPDLALVDVAMPVMGGLQAIPEMRRLVPDMWIAVLTVFSLDDLAGPAVAAGADLCLDKTRSPSELVRALAGLVGIDVEHGPVAEATETAEAFAAQALRESHAGFKGAFDEAAIGMALTDFEGRPLRVNGALCRLLGTTVEQTMSVPLSQREHPEHAARRPGDISPWGTAQSWSQTERAWVRADGELIWVSIDAAPVHDQRGRALYLFCQIQDVSSRRRAEEALRSSESRYRLLATNATDLIAITDSNLVLRYLSPSCRLILGYDPDELIGRRISDLWHADDARQFALIPPHAANAESDVDKFTVQAQRRDGRWVWLEVSQRIVVDAGTGEVAEIQTASRDITERKMLEARLTDLAMHDGLTGLANRVLVMDRLDHALARREGHGQVGVLFVDLDRFKVVNDTLGHSAGDSVLRETAERLRASIRPSDTAARLGGDEFVIVCEDLSGEAELIAVAERIESSLAAPHRLDGRDVVVTASVGIVLAPAGADGEQLVHRADSAMYDAKQAGRAQHRVWR